MQVTGAGDTITEANGKIDEGDGEGAIDLGLKIPHAQQQLRHLPEG
jgi:hypothetical protein